MDPALPPGGLQQIFRQYDAIRSHSAARPEEDPPPWEDDATPSQPTQVPAAPVTQNAPPPTPPSQAPPETVLTDATRPRPKGRPRAWQEDEETKAREAVAQRNMEFAIEHPNRGTFQDDEEGLTKAYQDTTYPGVYYNPQNRTLYVKGTVPTSASDWWDDVSKIPVWGDIHDAARMKMAEAAYKKLMEEGKVVDRVVGHSLGGSVALQLQQDKDIPYSRTYGAPVLSLNPFQKKTAERYRHPKDIVSVLDRGATETFGDSLNYHAYGGYSGNITTDGRFLGV